MRLALVAAVLACATVAAAPSANAWHLDCGGTVVDVGGQAYVIVKAVLSDGYLLWFDLYVESNGRDGVQEGGISLLGDAGLIQCDHNPDTRIL